MFKSASEIRSVTLAMNSLTNCSCIKLLLCSYTKAEVYVILFMPLWCLELNCLIGSREFSSVFCLHEYHDIFYFFEIFRRNFNLLLRKESTHICVLLFHCYICGFFSLIYLCIYFTSIYVIYFHSYICDFTSLIYE